MRNKNAMSTNDARPAKVAIIGASGTYGTGILARAEEIGVEAVVVTRSPHKFQNVKPTTTVVEAQLDEEDKLKEAFTGCDGVISALGDDRKERPKTHNLPHVWDAMKAAGVAKYIGMGSGPMLMPGEKRRGAFQRAVPPLLCVLKLFGVDFLEQNEWERDSLLKGENGADGITWVLTRVVRPTKTPFAGVYVHKDRRGPINCSIYDHGDFCLSCVASSEWDKLAPHVSSGPRKPKTTFVKRSLRVFLILICAMLVLIMAAVAGLFVYEPSPPDGFAFSSAGETIQLSDGRTLAYLETGDPEGRPVFYFHGGPGSRLEGLLYDEFNQQLGIRMIAVDRPGYGLSGFQENRTYLDWPDDVSELADQLGIDRFAVLGWSSGGPYAAVVAHEIPQRLTVAAIVAGEAPYASGDLPQSVLTGDAFSGSRANRLFIWSANNGPWLMRGLFRMMRIAVFRDPVGLLESSADANMSAKDKQFFARGEYSVSLVEAFRQGAKGMTHDFTIERLNWPFKLEEIQAPTVLIFHGEEDSGVDPGIAEYVCTRIPSCEAPTVYPGEGHSVVYHRYEEIIQAMLEAWI